MIESVVSLWAIRMEEARDVGLFSWTRIGLKSMSRKIVRIEIMFH